MPFWTYILECADGSYYVGHTDDLDARMAQHNLGVGSKYTARRRPVRLCWTQDHQTRDDAFRLEHQLKGRSRAKKEAVMRGNWQALPDLSRARSPFDKLRVSAIGAPAGVEAKEGGAGVGATPFANAPPPRYAAAMQPSAPLRLTIDLDALAHNWRWFAKRSAPAACGAAVKADGYGVGARAVVERLAREGCRTFFVATYAEAADLLPLPAGATLRVLHGVLPGDMAFALASEAVPILVSVDQVARWREAAPGRACDVMVDTGINRLGLGLGEIAALDGLVIDTLHSHLACADEPGHAMNARQLAAFGAIGVPARRRSLANSAGVCQGEAYHFDLTRPGIGLYGGVPHPAAAGQLRQVVRAQAQVIQVRTLKAGDAIGYNCTHVAARDTTVAILNLGYADGYLRGFSGTGRALVGDAELPVLGRVSMDLTAVDASAVSLREGDWVAVDLDLPRAAAASGLSQYELLTCLGDRYQRHYL
jgi:alanine racemase